MLRIEPAAALGRCGAGVQAQLTQVALLTQEIFGECVGKGCDKGIVSRCGALW